MYCGFWCFSLFLLLTVKERRGIPSKGNYNLVQKALAVFTSIYKLLSGLLPRQGPCIPSLSLKKWIWQYHRSMAIFRHEKEWSFLWCILSQPAKTFCLTIFSGVYKVSYHDNSFWGWGQNILCCCRKYVFHNSDFPCAFFKHPRRDLWFRFLFRPL